jgi:hypothetical protein
MRSRSSRKQEASVPPQEAVPPIFLLTPRPGAWTTGTHPFGDLFKHEKRRNDNDNTN